ncbi:MAG: glutamine--fructose-6-phosphate transaminase (isomerizing) [Candidatus Cloacimonadota bacterium]|nr:MAG: glutamine--fructose-6-phosphate transaminase (isomerizing) [Candidatus Cloacimonadota bacterium]PIE78272.1 MAG: glutamine--fructose-6-phosphate transaminase (isomerizing) [Candidatus Delongbacteria bacterium]
MCGIVGYIGNDFCKDFLIAGLKRVEYRGYDSAGIAIFNNGKSNIVKSVGPITELETKLNGKVDGNIGIAHTRWATHGEPSEENSHPHYSMNEKVILVHNGIIENYQTIKTKLEDKGYKFYSETDTEVLANLIDFYLEDDLESSVVRALKDVKGTYGIAVVNNQNPEEIVVAKLGSPLLIGIGENENYFASDASSILNKTKDVIYLNDNEIAVIKKDGITHKSLTREKVDTIVEKVNFDLSEIEKGGFDHFMHKEIFEQPKTIMDAMRGRLLIEEGTSKLGGLREKPKAYEALVNAKKIYIVACGTSWHSALIGEYMLEEYAKIPVEVEYGSEFRYRDPIIEEGNVVIAISQSGETADTLAAIKEAKRKGAVTIGLCNVVGSAIAKETDAGVYLHAGPEIGVASTKAFTSQIIVLALMTLEIARKKNMSFRDGYSIVKEMTILPNLAESILKNEEIIKEIAQRFKDVSNFIYLGRGYNFPVALEGALKLKEISYIHAEGYPAAEMKHGPIALIDENMPVVALATEDSIYEKVLSNIEEVKARKGIIISIANHGDDKIDKISDYVIRVPHTSNLLMPILTVIPLQLLSYHIAILRGCNVDMPRNLAKSVTVE